ncbi:hypothetical protein [Paraburkholderia tuberum]|uniref:Uncharacterized protein n=1 Tax=Paraburkholderia tuberum TaxID=157910 RepID=A0A1H1JTB2_9BURK|nr:hypothetical protein [Paraburkholderia tuberum]SDR52747.1 hypothetical protein SAMN05445850_5536 [Paraburkholderia tuberum]
MKLVALLTAPPEGHGDLDTLDKLDSLLGQKPPGAARACANVWLVDSDIAFDFLIRFSRMAERIGLKFEAHDRVPDETCI